MGQHMRRVIVLKTSMKLSDNVKAALKEIGTFWDDLFDAWVTPIEESESLRLIAQENGIKGQFREFPLPDEHLNQPKKDRAMYGKYSTLLERINREEAKLYSDIQIFEMSRTKRSQYLYEEAEPTREGKTHTEWLVEKGFWKKIMELRKLREEIIQVQNELKAIEMARKAETARI